MLGVHVQSSWAQHHLLKLCCLLQKGRHVRLLSRPARSCRSARSSSSLCSRSKSQAMLATARMSAGMRPPRSLDSRST